MLRKDIRCSKICYQHEQIRWERKGKIEEYIVGCSYRSNIKIGGTGMWRKRWCADGWPQTFRTETEKQKYTSN